jgi:hypothetical protein
VQLRALLVVVDAAVDQREFQAEAGAELLGVLVDLDRQLAGRRQDHRARVGRAAVGQRGWSSGDCTRVIRKARVLPVPVCAWPATSRPVSEIGRVSA